MTRNLREEMEGMSGPDSQTAWRPEPGDILVGRLIAYRSVLVDGHRRQLAMIEDERSGEGIAVWLSNVMLRNLFEEHKPQPGDRIGLKRFPDVQSGGAMGTGYKQYGMRVVRGATPAVAPPPAEEDIPF